MIHLYMNWSIIGFVELKVSLIIRSIHTFDTYMSGCLLNI